MKQRMATRKRSTAGGVVVRSGRPPRELAGEVEERILDAAAKVFLERGFEGASVDEIADVARAGKPTIYARFPGKEALFAAVMARTCAKSPAPSRALHRRVPRLKNVWRVLPWPSGGRFWLPRRSD